MDESRSAEIWDASLMEGFPACGKVWHEMILKDPPNPNQSGILAAFRSILHPELIINLSSQGLLFPNSPGCVQPLGNNEVLVRN